MSRRAAGYNARQIQANQAVSRLTRGFCAGAVDWQASCSVWCEEDFCAGKKACAGRGNKEQRQYEHIKVSAEKSGRYGGRAKEVAARTVLKQHKEKGHSKGE